MKSFDYDYHQRLEALAELMLANPDYQMKTMQAQVLQEYPLQSEAAQAHWMSWDIAFKAAELANIKAGILPLDTNREAVWFNSQGETVAQVYFDSKSKGWRADFKVIGGWISECWLTHDEAVKRLQQITGRGPDHD